MLNGSWIENLNSQQTIVYISLSNVISTNFYHKLQQSTFSFEYSRPTGKAMLESSILLLSFIIVINPKQLLYS